MKSWFEIKAKAEQSAPVEAFIYDEIGGDGITARDFVAAIRPYRDREITLRINSPGGEVWEGLAIYHYLKGLNVTVKVDGIAASMASIIALAGKRVEIASNGFLMIHNPVGGVSGGADDIAAYAEVLNKIRGSLVDIYQRETGASREQIEKWMSGETWFTAAEAKAAGMVDNITDEISFSASLSKFQKPPAALANLIDSETDRMGSETQKTFVDSLKAMLGIAPAPEAKIDAELIQSRADLATAKQTIGTLESRVKTLETENATLKTEAETAKAEADRTQTDLVTAKATIGTLEARTQVLEGENATLKTEAETAKAAAIEAKAESDKAIADAKADAEQAKVDAKADAEKQASIKAAAITAGQGQPPLDVKPSDTPAAAKNDASHLTGLERAIAAHKAGYDSNK